MTLCSLVGDYERFAGTWYHLQGSEYGGSSVLRNVDIHLRYYTSQKTTILIIIAVKTTKLTLKRCLILEF
jgi:hypothetical protein